MTDNSEKKSSPSVKLDPTVDFMAGTVAGLAALVVGYPFDTVKVRFQSPERRRNYNSTMNAITTIIREERFRGLYKGISSPLMLYTPLNGAVFAGYGFLTRIQLSSLSEEPSIAQLALAGTGTGLLTCFVTCPTELVKIRQQNVISGYTSARQVALDIFRRHGLRGMYRGLTATAFRECGYGTYFATYEVTCRFFRTPLRDPLSPPVRDGYFSSSSADEKVPTEARDKVTAWHTPWPAVLLAGGLAGVVSWASTFPFDVVKTRIQSVDYRPYTTSTLSTSPSSRAYLPGTYPTNVYQTTWSTFLYSYRSEGPSVFFRGLMPTVIRAFPVNMVTFAMFEAVVHALS